MKKSLLTLAILIASIAVYAQNTFPSTGNAGVGSSTPPDPFDVIANFNAVSGMAQSITATQSYSTQPYTLTGLNVNVSKGTSLGNSSATGINVLVNAGARAAGTASTTHYSINAQLIGSTATSSTGHQNYVSGYFSAASTTAVGETANIYGLEGVATGIGGMTTYGIYTNATGGTLNYGIYSASGTNYFNGNVTIGTTNGNGYKLAVDGTAIATSMTVKAFANWPDYVFTKDYRLPSLSEVKTYIDQNHRLPDMPSAQQVTKNGIDLGEMDRVLSKKVEELTLYLLEKDKKEQKQKAINAQLVKLLRSQQKQIDALKAMARHKSN